MATTQGQEMSPDGHETNNELAARNLFIDIQKLMEIRPMIVNALGTNTAGVQAFDAGVSKLLDTQHLLDAANRK